MTGMLCQRFYFARIGFHLDINEGRWCLSGLQPTTPMIERDDRIAFVVAKLGEGQCRVVESVDAITPLLGE